MTIRTGGLTIVAMLALSGLALGQGAPTALQRPAPPPLPPEVASGRAVFEQNCSFCHGADAEGQSGPDLTSSKLVLSDVDGNAIGPVVLNGRPGTAMTAFKFTPAQIQDIAAFLHFQSYAAMKQEGGRKGVVPADLQTGDATAGKAFFNGAGGCSTCHSPTGDLAGVATRLQGLQLEESFLTAPRDTVSVGPAELGIGGRGGRGGRGPQPAAIAKVTVTLPSGEVINGKLVYQDDFNIALVDEAGYYHSWPTSQVKFSVNAPGEAHTALLAKYTDADIHNLMAYLQTLNGPAQPASAPNDPPSASAPASDLNPGVNTAMLLKPPVSAWPTYHGDYTGRRHSSLAQITPSNVSQLGVAWQFSSAGRNISSSPLVVDGVMYVTAPNNIWAVDARTGHEIWHYTAPPNEGSTIGNRGVAMYNNWLYFEIPDGHLVSLNAKDGSVRWIKEIVDYHLGYWTSTSPLVVGDHIVIGASGDFDNVQSVLRAVDPETGDTQWTWNATPPSTPNTATGGNTWMTGTYDPTLNLLYWGTGNPTPVLEGATRPGNNLYTCSIVALNPDTGKMAWAFQASPHDTHDWDAAEVPVLVDGTFKGRPRKMLMQASRNGYFFVIDRTNGESLLTTPFGPVNWASGVGKDGSPIPSPEKEPAVDGRLVAPAEGGLANYRSPSFDPQTGLFIVNSSPSYGIYFNKPADGTFGWAGADYGVYSTGVLEALDYQTGKARWKHAWTGGSGSGVLTTDSGLTFVADSEGNFVALNTGDGNILWHSATGSRTSASPMTYELDGRQYVVSSFGGTVIAWALSNN